MRIDLWPGKDMGEFMPYMETFILDTPTPRGAVIVCPGGGYSHRARHEGNPVAEKFNALGVSQYGQMTAGSYMYIGPQGIVHGTTITVLNAARKQIQKGLAKEIPGKIFISAGLGGM